VPGDLKETEAEYFKPTLVNENNQVVGLSDYYCHDVKGILSYMKENAESIDTMNFLEGNVIISWNNFEISDPAQIIVEFYDEFEIETATLDGTSGAVVGQSTSGWTGTGRTPTVISSDGIFSGTMEVIEERWTSQVDGTSKVTEIHNFFGYISTEDRSAYFCDLLANPIPSDLAGLTAENFQDNCPVHYYECLPSSP
jgi:hypothetical protein